ncbi:hypothetical protein BDV26DRAFT_296054 [Aspergillus bertholletiae]|uniref:Fucose-specific lectin n=1 Tax=Aspergillus bertholletiae TaxID=1226010 RepID=A0A5N7AZQ3_9EURO|nr:hypothetical protein BDV26DRAFT_296054 [Aspergillus bertholletiae]
MTSTASAEPHSTLEVDFRASDTHKEPATIVPHYGREEEQVAAHEGVSGVCTSPTGLEKRTLGLRRRYLWLAAAALAACVVVGAVVGGVVGSRSNTRDPKPTSPSLDTNSTRSSNLAAVYYWDRDNITHHRLYVQKDDNWIHEYSRNGASSWSLTSKLQAAVSKSPIAASVVYGTVALDLRVYFASEANFIQEFITRDTTKTATQWTADPPTNSLSKMNIRVHDSSGLAAFWLYQNQTNYYPWCFYQDGEGELRLRGSDGWQTQHIPFPIPRPGTPLAMTQSWPFYNPGNLALLTMFYQGNNGQIQSMWGTEVSGWKEVTVPIPAYSSDENTSLAAFVYTPSEGATGFMVVLLSNSTGVTSFMIEEGQRVWNIDKPPAMSILDRSSPLTATEDGRAFGISNGTVTEFRFSSDGSWGAVGDVLEL